MGTYYVYLIRNVFILGAAIVGGRLVRRRWLRHPEACALVAWGCGLIICLELAHAAVIQALFHRDVVATGIQANSVRRAVYDLVSWLYLILNGLALWILIRSALRAIDTDRPATAKLAADQLHVLFPLVRTYHSWSGCKILILNQTQLLIGQLTSPQVSEHVIHFPDAAHLDAVTRFDLRPVNSGGEAPVAVTAESVGVIGPSRHWRRLQFSSGATTRSFWVPLKDYANLRDALNLVVPGGVRETNRPRRSACERLLLFATILFMCINLAFDLIANRDGSLPKQLLSTEPLSTETFAQAAVNSIVLGATYMAWLGPVAVLFAYLITGWVAVRSSLRPALPAARVRRGPASGNPQFRSPVLGWSIKVCAFIYNLFILGSPAVDRWVTASWEASPKSGWYLEALLSIPVVPSMYIGHLLCRRTFAPGSHPDPRPPFLFLRAFDDDDRKTLQPRTWLAWFHGLEPESGRRGAGLSLWQRIKARTSLKWSHFHPVRWFRVFIGLPVETVDEQLAIGTRHVGPLVAIGEPGERNSISGADLMYVSDEKWQEVVLSYLGNAAGVVLQPSLSDGVLWELEQVFRHVPRHRVLLSMLNFQGRPNEYERLWLLFKNQHGLELPRAVPHVSRPCFLSFSSSGQVVLQPVVYHAMPLWPITGNAINIASSLQPYLSGLDGTADPDPVQLERSGFLGALVSVLVTAALTAFVFFGLPDLIRWILVTCGLG